MRRAGSCVALGLALLLADRIGHRFEEHVAVVSGMPVAPSSWLVGPLVVVARLLAALAPIPILAGLADGLLQFRRPRV